MEPERLPNGNLRVPMWAYDEEEDILGDGVVVIGPDHHLFKPWNDFLEGRFDTEPADEDST